MSARGFVLIEWLLASAIVLLVSGAVLGSLSPARDAVERAQQTNDLAAAVPAALDTLVADVLEAGADGAVSARGAALARGIPPVQVLESLATGIAVGRGAAVQVTRVPRRAAQARLRLPALAGDTVLSLEMDVRCATGAPACGFRRGDHAALVTSDRAVRVTVDAALADAVVLSHALDRDVAAGAMLCQLHTSTYGLRPVAGAADRLVRISDGGAEQPVLDHVVMFDVLGDPADSVLVGRVELRLRAQASRADLRGPAGPLFVNAGTAANARRWLPDLELRRIVTLRNRRAAW